MELHVAVNKRLGNFTLEAEFKSTGSNMGVFGPSGSGKSTLVSLIAGLQQPDSGVISLNGEAMFNSQENINMLPEKRHIGIVFQHPHLFPHLCVRKNLLYGFKRTAPENRNIDLDSLIGILKLEDLLDRGVRNLSGGEQQRVAIGRAILSNPRLLLMDEPLSALDDNLKFQIINYLKIACATFNIPYLFISHSLVEMRLMADNVLVFDKGEIITETSTEQLARQKMGSSSVGYINLIKAHKVGKARLSLYSWGKNELLVSVNSHLDDAILELSSRDIILCKDNPGAISARNLLHCKVISIFTTNGKTGVELDCCGQTLIAEVVDEAANELGLDSGTEVFAAIKASSFRVLQ